MALTMMEGFELSHLPAGASSIASVTAYETGRAGGLAFGFGKSGAVGTQTFTCTLPLGATQASGSVAAALFLTGVASLPTTMTFMGVYEGTVCHLGLRFKANGTVAIVRGDGVELVATTAVITAVADTWNHYELSYLIADGTGGAATLKINGVAAATISGVDTRNAGTTGQVSTCVFSGSFSQGTGRIRVDDYVCTDTTGPAPYNAGLGDCVVETVYPSGSGDSSQWVGSDGDSADNYALVDDVSTTDYVASGTVGNRDLYQLADGSPTFGACLATQAEVLVAKSDSGTPPGPLVALEKSVGGTVTAQVLLAVAEMTTTYAWRSTPIRATDPNGDSWTQTRFAGLQVGVEVGA
jgi:hypothetical protein